MKRRRAPVHGPVKLEAAGEWVCLCLCLRLCLCLCMRLCLICVRGCVKGDQQGVPPVGRKVGFKWCKGVSLGCWGLRESVKCSRAGFQALFQGSLKGGVGVSSGAFSVINLRACAFACVRACSAW